MHSTHNIITKSPHRRLELYSKALALLHHLIALNPALDGQHRRLAASPQVRSLAVDSAAEAIGAGKLEQAVSMLEQGRRVLLSLLQEYRTAVDDLHKANSELADELYSIGSSLEELSSTATRWESLPHHLRDELLVKQRALSEQRNATLDKIRLLPGFEDYLLPPEYEKLREAASEGPVIVVTGCEVRCDALIVTTAGAPVLVPLSDASLVQLATQFDIFFKKRLGNSANGLLLDLLRFLWKVVVSPIVSKLLELGFKRRQHIWWCPTNGFTTLPLHAAGEYAPSGGQDLPDIFISSYTATLSSLIDARANSIARGHSPNLLLVGHQGFPELKYVEEELARIKAIPGLSANTLFGPAANRDLVLGGMSQHLWVHLSCHGVVDHQRPFNSSFELDQEQRLTVGDIIRAKLPDAELIFLSACHSAAASNNGLDENLHLASALQFAGFKSVIGTTWEMFDKDGPSLAKNFYRKLIKSGGDYRKSAAALHHAISKMRKKKIPAERWAMFVHIGA